MCNALRTDTLDSIIVKESRKMQCCAEDAISVGRSAKCGRRIGDGTELLKLCRSNSPSARLNDHQRSIGQSRAGLEKWAQVPRLGQSSAQLFSSSATALLRHG